MTNLTNSLKIMLTVVFASVLLTQFACAQDGKQSTKEPDAKETSYLDMDRPNHNFEAPVQKTEAEWKQSLSGEQYRVTRLCGTERPFKNTFWDHTGQGDYHCVACGQKLFTSEAKFDSHCGWPSFTEPANEDAIRYLEDNTHGMQRTETRCSKCDAHLGHVFKDGPPPKHDRFCINSVCLKFIGDDGTVLVDKGN